MGFNGRAAVSPAVRPNHLSGLRPGTVLDADQPRVVLGILRQLAEEVRVQVVVRGINNPGQRCFLRHLVRKSGGVGRAFDR